MAADHAKHARAVIRQNRLGKSYWLVKAGNHRIVMVGTGRFGSDREAASEFLWLCNTNSPVDWSLYEDKSGKWRWTMFLAGSKEHSNKACRTKRKVAAPYEPFASKGNAKKAAVRCRRLLFAMDYSMIQTAKEA